LRTDNRWCVLPNEKTKNPTKSRVLALSGSCRNLTVREPTHNIYERNGRKTNDCFATVKNPISLWSTRAHLNIICKSWISLFATMFAGRLDRQTTHYRDGTAHRVELNTSKILTWNVYVDVLQTITKYFNND